MARKFIKQYVQTGYQCFVATSSELCEILGTGAFSFPCTYLLIRMLSLLSLQNTVELSGDYNNSRFENNHFINIKTQTNYVNFLI